MAIWVLPYKRLSIDQQKAVSLWIAIQSEHFQATLIEENKNNAAQWAGMSAICLFEFLLTRGGGQWSGCGVRHRENGKLAY